MESTQSFTHRLQATIEITQQDHSIIAYFHHLQVQFLTHILLMVHRVLNFALTQ